MSYYQYQVNYLSRCADVKFYSSFCIYEYMMDCESACEEFCSEIFEEGCTILDKQIVLLGVVKDHS